MICKIKSFCYEIDCKSAKYVIEKDVENITSKHIFVQWQAILSVFYFDIEYINGSQNTILDFLTRECWTLWSLVMFDPVNNPIRPDPNNVA